MTTVGFDWMALAEYSITGFLAGGLLSLIALGFVLIYKGTGVINFAMGEFMMLGAYCFYTANKVWGFAMLPAMLVTVAAIGLFAAIIERGILRPLSGQPVISVLMATIGLASVIHGGVDMVWGGINLEMPELLSRKAFRFGEIFIPGKTLWSFVLAAVVITVFSIYFRYSSTGVSMRAAASDPITASALGIDVRRTQVLTWIFAGIVGAVAGVIAASMTTLSPALSQIALGVFAVIILGGLDSIVGAIVAGLLIGVIESLTSAYLGGKVRSEERRVGKECRP